MPILPGIDGRKMSKSYNNAIYLSDPPEVIASKVSQMVTDPQRGRRHDPGDPEVCSVFAYHRLYTEGERVEEIARECRRAGIGCVDCKKILAANLKAYLAPIQERRAHHLTHLSEVREIMEEGTARAREVARTTMEEVREAIELG